VTIPDETREDTRDEAVDGDSDEETEARAEAVDDGEEAEALLPDDNAQRFRERWESVQAGFVDKPRETVEEADDLVRDLVQELTAGLVRRRENLERHWSEGGDASTEDLRSR
jgi:hypothetical protein